MSEPPHFVIASIEALLQRTIRCKSSCWGCRGTDPGCKTNPDERLRREINNIRQKLSLRYSFFFKRNFCTIYFISCVGQKHFLPYGSKMKVYTATEEVLMDLQRNSMRIRSIEREICQVNCRLERLIPELFPQFERSRANFKALCDWMEDDFPFVQKRVLKKMLMISLALGFLTRRLVGRSTFLRVMMFHSIFKETLLRKKNSKLNALFDNPLRDGDYLNNIFKPPKPIHFRW
jgi:hypothetical protein